jgi:hypothetical protein
MRAVEIILVILFILLTIHLVLVRYCYKHKCPIHIVIPILPGIFFVILYQHIQTLDDETVMLDIGFAQLK